MIVLLTALALTSSPSWEPYDVDLAKAAMVRKDSSLGWDHLVPPGRLVEERRRCIAAYRYMPSFEPSAGWCVLSDGGKVLVQSWGMPSTALEPNIDSQSTVKALDPGIVALIREIWVNVLMQTHYPPFDASGTDGETHYFSAIGVGTDLSGEVWSPQRDDPPAWIAQAATTVLLFARSPDSDDAALKTALRSIRDRIFAYYRSHPTINVAPNKRLERP